MRSRYDKRDEEDDLDESHVVQMESVQQSHQVDEAAINAVLKKEIDQINNSLMKITQALNSTKADRSSIKVKDDVSDTMSRSLNLWNSMMFSLSNRTSFNPNLLQSQSVSASNTNMMQSQSSFYSQVSVKDDARDLLEKYSQLLVEEISKKLVNKK